MVIAPLVLAVNIATMGSSSPATSAAATSRISELMKQLAESTKDIRELYKLVKQVGTVAFETDKTMQMWVTDYIGDFESMTTKRVVTELSKHFNGPTLYWVKQQYAMNHLTLILKSDGIQTAQNVLSAISTFDPTGVTGVVSAFANPMCASDQNFPPVKLRPIY